MAHVRVRKGLRGQSKLVRSQFTGKRKRPRKRVDSQDDFKKQALTVARIHLENAIEWIDQNSSYWALDQAQRAVKLLEVSR